MLANTTIGTKLMAVVTALLLIMLLIGGYSLYSLNDVCDNLEIALSSTARKLDVSQALRYRVQESVATQRGFLMAYATDHPEDAPAYRERWQAAMDRIKAQVEEIRPMIVTPEDLQRLDEVLQARQSWLPAGEEYMQLAQNKQIIEADNVMRSRIRPHITLMEAHATKVMERQREFLQQTQLQAASAQAWTMGIVMFLIVVGVLACGAAVLLVRGINRDLREIVNELSRGSEEVASAAAQVSSAAQSMSQAASEQAASLEETSASSEELNSMTQKNAENSHQAAREVEETTRLVQESNRQLESMLSSMSAINDSSAKISKIIKVIDEIAFQTNILALNAAVEAARAGNAGMGFAVVADEVRNLAQRSAQAAKDTAELIEDSIERSGEGSSKLNEVADAIRKITSNSESVRTLVSEVSLGSQEQARGIEQIAKAITQMEQVTQQVAANAEESAASSEELNSQAESVDGVVARLTAMVGGAETQTAKAGRRFKPGRLHGSAIATR